MLFFDPLLSPPSPSFLSVVLLGMSLYLFQQLAGINAVVYYSTAVFRKVGIKSDVAASALVGLANVVGIYTHAHNPKP